MTTLLEDLDQIVRYVQGERPGMSIGQVDGLFDPVYTPPTVSIAIEHTVMLADVSFWQSEINFEEMKASGLAGAIIRAGQRTWIDTRFKENWTKCKLAAVPRGSYWFYDSREDPVNQAEMWWDLIKNDVGELVHCADFEESYNGPFGKREHFKQFLQTFQSLSRLPNKRIVVYTGYYWWTDRIGNDLYFKRFRVWIAWYSAMQYVKVPAPWAEEDLIFWQFTSSGDGHYHGVGSAEIDLNYYWSTITDFMAYFGITETPVEPPPNGEPMLTDYYEIKSNANSSRSIRTGPGIRSLKIVKNGDLFAGKIAKAGTTPADIFIYEADVPDAGIQGGKSAWKGDTWRKVFENDGVPVEGWVAETHLGYKYIDIELKPATGTPTPLPGLPVVITLGDDVIYEKQTVSIVLKPKV